MHSGFPDVRDQLTMDFARTHADARIARRRRKAQIARIIAAWTDALARYGKDGGFLFGRFSDRRLHVCAGRLALPHLWHRACRRSAQAYARPHLRAARDARLGRARRKTEVEAGLA